MGVAAWFSWSLRTAFTPELFSARTCLQIVTGAAHMTFCVNVPAATAPSSHTTSARSALEPARMPEYMPLPLKPFGARTAPGISFHVPSPSGINRGADSMPKNSLSKPTLHRLIGNFLR